jgi:hypothetical protein
LWREAENGSTIGTRGSEKGLILRDEEHSAGARITLEAVGGSLPIPFAIACGLYGWFVHTCFLGAEQEAMSAYEAMRGELGRIAEMKDESSADADEHGSKILRAIDDFVDRFPT